MPVAFALVGANDGTHMRRFLNNLRSHGLLPQVVVTDGSTLYPKLLAELWPHAAHQLCVFHVMQDLNRKVLDAVKRLRRAVSRRGNRGRKRKRGRPSKAQQRRRNKQQKTQKEKANFVFKHRHLIVMRRDNLSEQDRRDLATMLEVSNKIKLGSLHDQQIAWVLEEILIVMTVEVAKIIWVN